MNAVISGQAGVALLVNGPELASIHAGRGSEVISRRPEEVRFLLGDARDLEFIEDIDVQEVSRRLEVETTKYDALHISLILLDESLSHDTRREAAEELEELLEEAEVTDFPERVLFSHPFPRGADPSGARACCTGRTPKVRALLDRLDALQPLIAEVHEAWERIPDSAFGSIGERSHAQATFVREGLFRDLVQTLADRRSIDTFPAQVRWSKEVEQVRRKILREWIHSLRTQRQEPMYAAFRPGVGRVAEVAAKVRESPQPPAVSYPESAKERRLLIPNGIQFETGEYAYSPVSAAWVRQQPDPAGY